MDGHPLSYAGEPVLSARTHEFYRRCLAELLGSGVPFVVGGAHALRRYTGIVRHTKDLDVFVRPRDRFRALDALALAGYAVRIVNAGWLAKAYGDGPASGAYIDVIFRIGNGVGEIGDSFFARASTIQLFGLAVPLCPPEEVIWSKAFTMERERFDLADIAHVIAAEGTRLDWPHLLGLFGRYWRILLADLILFGFIYPGRQSVVPAAVMDDLLGRLDRERRAPAPATDLCRGTLLSSTQYLPDVLYHGLRDARVVEAHAMSPDELAAWQATIAAEAGQRLRDAGYLATLQRGGEP